MAELTAKQAAFVAAVEDGKAISAAAALAHVNPTTHYRWMAQNETYQDAPDALQLCGLRLVPSTRRRFVPVAVVPGLPLQHPREYPQPATYAADSLGNDSGMEGGGRGHVRLPELAAGLGDWHARGTTPMGIRPQCPGRARRRLRA